MLREEKKGKLLMAKKVKSVYSSVLAAHTFYCMKYLLHLRDRMG